MRVTNISLFYLHDLPLLKPYGSIEIDTVDNPEKWLLYCVKNKELMELVYSVTNDRLSYMIVTNDEYDDFFNDQLDD